MIGSTFQKKIAISTLCVESQAFEACTWVLNENQSSGHDSSRLSNKTTSDEKARKLDKAIPRFFFRLASNAFPDIGSVGRIEKKNLKEKSQEVSE